MLPPACAAVLIFAGAVFLSACANGESVHQDVITVEGTVTARGNEPFVRYVLETSEGNLYAIRVADDENRFETPSTLRVTGRLYADEWQGRSFAHIDVSEWERLERP